MRILRWGLLSTARINRSLIPPLRASARNDVVAMASRDLARAEAYAAQWDIPQAYGSYEALLADPDIDVIYNPLPNHLHAAWTIRAAEAGKHILCEKPLAMTVAEVDAMAAAAEANEVVIAEAFMYRHHPQTVQLKTLIDSGEIGDLHLIRGAFSFVLERPGNSKWDPDRGGGALCDVGCYPISLMRYLVGAEPASVMGHQVLGETGVDVSFAGTLRFPDDVIGQFDAAFRSQFRMEVEVVGSKGRVHVPFAFKPRADYPMQLRQGDTVTTLPVAKVQGHLYAGEVEDLYDAVVAGTPPRVSLAESRGNIAAITALYASAQAQQPVTLA